MKRKKVSGVYAGPAKVRLAHPVNLAVARRVHEVLTAKTAYAEFKGSQLLELAADKRSEGDSRSADLIELLAQKVPASQRVKELMTPRKWNNLFKRLGPPPQR